jgi:hypothetical protein
MSFFFMRHRKGQQDDDQCAKNQEAFIKRTYFLHDTLIKKLCPDDGLHIDQVTESLVRV